MARVFPFLRDLGKPRPVIQCDDDDDDEDEEDEQMEEEEESNEEEEGLMDALIQSSSDGDIDNGDSEGELRAPLDIVTAPAATARQSSITSFLSGKFTAGTVDGEAGEPAGQAEPPMKARSHRSVFFDEEAEDEEDELADRADELLDEAAIEADLRASKFIADDHEAEAEEEAAEHAQDAPHHLDIHRALMRAEDERQLDEVVQRFVRDKAMTDSLAFQSLQAKYGGAGSESEGDAGGDGHGGLLEDGGKTRHWAHRRLQHPVMEHGQRKRTDDALFDLIRAEMHSSEEDEDEGSASYSEPDPFHDDEAIMQSLGEEPTVDVEEAADKEPGLEDALLGLFTAAEPVRAAPSKAKPSSKPAAAYTIDPQRRARLLATEEEDAPSATTTASSKAGAAFTRK